MGGWSMACDLQGMFKTILQTPMSRSTPANVTGPTPEIGEHHLSLLIVDDETLVCWSLASALTKAGYRVEIVYSGEKAIEVVRTRSFDLLVSDVELPAMSGYELASSVRVRFPSLPIILMSATEAQPHSPETPSFDHFVEKPFHISEMVELIDKLLLNIPQTSAREGNRVN